MLKRLRWLPAFAVLVACVDRINFDTPSIEGMTVIEGAITDEPGPYTVYISTAFSVDAPTRKRDPIKDAHVELYEDDIKIGVFAETDPGVYKTPPSIRGRVGHVYHVSISTTTGKKYTSIPERLATSGELIDITYDAQEATQMTADGPQPRVRVNLYIDGQPSPDPNTYTRWRVTGTYKIRTFPERVVVEDAETGTSTPAPLPCSGWIYDGGQLRQVGPCTCCICWVTAESKLPRVSAEVLRGSEGFKHHWIERFEANTRTLYEAYRVEVEQLAISENAHNFFRLLTAQSEGVGSLFQPAFGEIKGNITAADSDEQVLGLFWAASVYRRSIYITKASIPGFTLPVIRDLADACTIVGDKSTTERPAFWGL